MSAPGGSAQAWEARVNSGRFAVAAVVIAAAFVTSVYQAQPNVAADLAAMADDLDLRALEPSGSVRSELYALGEALFFDPELSGNRDVACATCHVPARASTDGLPIAIGTGGTGVGPDRVADGRVIETSRNTTDLLNRGTAEWSALTWDARLQAIDGRVHLIGGGELPGSDAVEELGSLLQAQAMLAPLDPAMRGEAGDVAVNGRVNELAFRTSAESVWNALMRRLLRFDGYLDLFSAAYPDTDADDLTFAHAAEALAAYESEAFLAPDAAWDQYLRGEDERRLSLDAMQGALLFYGEAGCAACHAGPLFTDHKTRSIGMPPFAIDPPAAAIDLGMDIDFGRMGVTSQESDRFAFRTPSLRNVAETAPYGHSGAFSELEGIIRHHIDPAASLREFGLSESADALDLTELDGQTLFYRLVESIDDELAVPPLTNTEIRQIEAFLATLTDDDAVRGPRPLAEVPSGLPAGP